MAWGPPRRSDGQPGARGPPVAGRAPEGGREGLGPRPGEEAHRAGSLGAAGPPEPKRRGSAAGARSLATEPEALQAAVRDLRANYFGKNTAQVKRSKLALAEEIARKAGFTNIYHLSIECVATVAAVSKASSFRSANSYITELRLKHVELNFTVGPALGRTFKLVNDSLERGLGPATKAAELKLGEAELETADEDDVDILGFQDSYVVAVGWLLRGIELNNLRAIKDQVFVNGEPGNERVTLRLPTSKTDQEGKGAARQLAHECRGNSSWEALNEHTCPVCAVLRQLGRLRRHFRVDTQEELFERGLPLFPLKLGLAPSKAQVIEAWRRLAPDRDAQQVVSGHSARRSGAKRRARMGWSMWQIQFMGRWAAGTVVEYVEEAMAELTASWPRPEGPRGRRARGRAEQAPRAALRPRGHRAPPEERRPCR